MQALKDNLVFFYGANHFCYAYQNKYGNYDLIDYLLPKFTYLNVKAEDLEEVDYYPYSHHFNISKEEYENIFEKTKRELIIRNNFLSW